MKADAISGETVYFAKPGRENTEDTLALAKKRADELGITSILCATTVGETAATAAKLFEGYRFVAVTHSTGAREPNVQELDDKYRSQIESYGGVILTTTHAFGGVGRAVRRHFNTYEVDEIIANTLRVMGQGIKVVCEIALMAADAGLVRTDQEVVVIAGTGRGADTAVVLQPANAQDFFNLRVKEILCKPRL
jgi:hypothetical protein